ATVSLVRPRQFRFAASVSSAYRIASPFLIRLAGVPFDVIEELATPNVFAAARRLLAWENELGQVKNTALEFVTRRNSGLNSEEFAAWRIAIRRDKIPDQKIPQQLQEYSRVAIAARQAHSQLEHQLEGELTGARRALLQTSQRILPHYLVFGSGDVHHLIDHSGAELPPRNSRNRERERHLLLYLQRIAAKNDTFGEFGPSAWGSAIQSGSLNFEPRPGIARREVFLERWTAHALTAAINSDPQTFLERRPRLNPNGILSDNRLIFVDSGDVIALTPSEIELVRQCNGTTSIHALIQSSAHFSGRTEPNQRQQILSAARAQLSQLGAERNPSQRSLYAAVNPIAEECFRDCEFEINETMLDEVVTAAEPWIDFWRDNYAFVASRVAAGLRLVLDKVGKNALPL